MDHRLLRKYDGKKLGWLRDSKKFLLLLLITIGVFHVFIGVSAIKGHSMEPTLKEGEVVFYTRFSRNFHRGDVVPVRVPSGDYYVKRIIAAGGDTIDIQDGQFLLNGEPLEEPYTQGLTMEDAGSVRYPYTLKEGDFFVVGDNREASTDSRAFGPVSSRQIRGKILFSIGKLYVHRL